MNGEVIDLISSDDEGGGTGPTILSTGLAQLERNKKRFDVYLGRTENWSMLPVELKNSVIEYLSNYSCWLVMTIFGTPSDSPTCDPGIPTARTQGIYSREDFEGLLTAFEDLPAFDKVGDAKYTANIISLLSNSTETDIEMRVIRKQSSIKAMIEFYGEQEILGHSNLFDYVRGYWDW